MGLDPSRVTAIFMPRATKSRILEILRVFTYYIGTTRAP